MKHNFNLVVGPEGLPFSSDIRQLDMSNPVNSGVGFIGAFRAKSNLFIAPITGRAALAWIAETHRHLPKLQGALFAVAVRQGRELVGAGTVGNPPRVWQGTGRMVISRVAVLENCRW